MRQLFTTASFDIYSLVVESSHFPLIINALTGNGDGHLSTLERYPMASGVVPQRRQRLKRERERRLREYRTVEETSLIGCALGRNYLSPVRRVHLPVKTAASGWREQLSSGNQVRVVHSSGIDFHPRRTHRTPHTHTCISDKLKKKNNKRRNKCISAKKEERERERKFISRESVNGHLYLFDKC